MKDSTKRILKSSKLRKLFDTHCVQGGAKSLIVGGEHIKASDIAAHYGVDLKKADKYKEQPHAGMEQIEPSGSVEHTGDGDSQEQE